VGCDDAACTVRIATVRYMTQLLATTAALAQQAALLASPAFWYAWALLWLINGWMKRPVARTARRSTVMIRPPLHLKFSSGRLVPPTRSIRRVSSPRYSACRPRCYSVSSPRLRRRSSSSGDSRRGGNIGRANPYSVLGVPATSDYDEVRRAFVRLALDHHPDVRGGERQEKAVAVAAAAENENDAFIRIRLAFEAIREEMRYSGDDGGGDDNGIEDDDEPLTDWSAAELREWYRRQTGEWLTFEMCEQTRREVIAVYKSMSHGGKDMGGYWDMARQLAEREEARIGSSTGDDGPLKQLTTGSSSEAGINSSPTRRRQRRR